MFQPNFNGLRKRETYDEIINYLQNDQEILRYPDRFARRIREHPYLTQLDGEGVREMEEQQTKRMLEEEKENNIRRLASAGAESAQQLRATGSSSNSSSSSSSSSGMMTPMSVSVQLLPLGVRRPSYLPNDDDQISVYSAVSAASASHSDEAMRQRKLEKLRDEAKTSMTNIYGHSDSMASAISVNEMIHQEAERLQELKRKEADERAQKFDIASPRGENPNVTKDVLDRVYGKSLMNFADTPEAVDVSSERELDFAELNEVGDIKNKLATYVDSSGISRRIRVDTVDGLLMQAMKKGMKVSEINTDSRYHIIAALMNNDRQKAGLDGKAVVRGTGKTGNPYKIEIVYQKNKK